MKRCSPKAEARAAEAAPFRRQLIWEVGCCEACGHEPGRAKWGQLDWPLAVHEIANGPRRQKALDRPYAVLVACWWCNGEELTDRRKWPVARQLAALKRSRPEDYDLAAYLALSGRAPTAITEEEVSQYDE